MNTASVIRIDRMVGAPLLALANVAARVAGVFGAIRHDVGPDRVRCIAVAKFLGMGSIVQATPLLQALRRQFPNARLIFVTTDAHRDFVERLGLVDQVITVKHTGLLPLATSALAARRALRRKRVDLYFDLEVYSSFACLFALAALARNRYGFFRHHAGFRRGAHTHLLYFNTRRPISEVYLQLGAISGATAGVEEHPLVGPGVRPEEHKRVGGLLYQHFGDDCARYLVINPNASDLLVERRWPADSFRELIRGLADRGERIVVIGSPGERAHAASVIPDGLEEHGRVWNAAGEVNIGELAALLDGASAVITNDTGPMHLAAAVGVPLVCLFGPCDPAHYGFRGENVATLYKSIFCSPCVHETDKPPCAGDNQCMKRIAVDEVFSALDRVLAVGKIHPGGALEGESPRPVHIEGFDRENSLSHAGEPVCVCCGGGEFLPLHRWERYLVQRCRTCGSERLSPPPSPERLAEIYQPSYYDAWGTIEDEASVDAMKRTSFRAMLGALPRDVRGGRLLDCGAAFGALMAEAQELGFDVRGVELNPRGAEAIRRRLGDDRVFEGPFENAPDDDTFDVVTMFDFIEHLPDPAGALSKAATLLRPRGVLLLCTPNPATLGRRLMGGRWLHLKEEHLNYFTPSGMRTLLRSSGFRNVEIRTARKRLTADYIDNQFRRYEHPLLSPCVGGAVRLMPRRVAERPFPVAFGEMLVMARRR